MSQHIHARQGGVPGRTFGFSFGFPNLFNPKESASVRSQRTLTEFLDHPTFSEIVTRLDLALEGANIGIWDWDLRDGAVHFDRRWCEMLGLNPENVRQELRTWEERVHPDDLAPTYEAVSCYIRGETDRYESVHRLRHENGSWVSVLDRGRISGWDSQGVPIRFTGTHLDITEAERARLAQSRELGILKGVVAHFPFAVALLDSDLRYVSVGAKWLRCNSVKIEELLGKSIDESREKIPFFRIAGDWAARFRQVLTGESIHRDRDSYRTPTGELVTVRWTLSPWGAENGEVSGVMIVLEDISSAVEADLRVLQSARLASLGEMAGSIAHEINTPLATISLLAGQILDVLDESGLDCNRENLAWIRQQAAQVEATVGRISRVTRSMLALARSEEGPQTRRVELGALVEDSLAVVRERVRLAGVDLEVHLPSERTELLCLPTETGQVLLNLVRNALDSICTIGPSERRPGHRIRIEALPTQIRVSDTGPAIPQSVQEKLFQPFFTTKPVGQGTGIGLALSRRIMARQGGCLLFSQEKGEKTFVLDFSRTA